MLRSLLPLHNPLGFGAGDFVELVFAALLLVVLFLYRSSLTRQLQALAPRTGWCMLLIGLLPVALRLALLPHYPIPTPAVSDDFSYLLLADTLRHFRLANPPHPLHQFFETFFVLQQPSYSSIFPLGQGLVQALGWMLPGSPWAGVALSIGCFCALCYWMLRAWTTPGWALLGGVLAAIQFGPLNQWMNSYWGGAVSASAGCLVFGALPRLRDGWSPRNSAFLGLGFALQFLTRPFEFLFLVISAAIFLLPSLRDRTFRPALLKTALIATLVMLPFLGLTLLQNKAVTGAWTELPYQLSRSEYGVPTTFTLQPLPIPHRELTREQRLDYDIQSSVHGQGTDTLAKYLDRLAGRIRFYRFFLLPPLYLALLAFILTARDFRSLWVLGTIVIFAVGTNFYSYFYSHYIAAIACLFVLSSVVGLERLSRLQIRNHPVGRDVGLLIVALCFAHFLFWYGLHLIGNQDTVQPMFEYETWDAINHGDPEGRISIHNQLTGMPGKQLVFVRYGPQHLFKEWVHNAADIDASRIVWARDLGPAENQKLLHYYPGRTAWLLEPDAKPPKLVRYNLER